MPARVLPIGELGVRPAIVAETCRAGLGLLARRLFEVYVSSLSVALVLVMLSEESIAAGEPLALGIKAAYLPKFAPFVEWPPSAFVGPTSPLTICVMANDPVAPVLEQVIIGQKDGNRPIEIRTLAETDSPDGCHILYFEPDDLAGAKIAEGATSHPTLTISGPGPASHAMVTLVIDGNRMRFDIDDAMAARAGLDIGSGLLALARKVTRAP
jgi:uncharacterized protein DUF4154